MGHIIINPSLSAAIGYNIFFNPPKFAVVIAILEPANSTRTDNSARFSRVCNVLRHWRIWLIPTYRVYRLYDIYL